VELKVELKEELKEGYVHLLLFECPLQSACDMLFTTNGKSIQSFIKRCFLPGDTRCTVWYQQPLCQKYNVPVLTDNIYFEVLTASTTEYPFPLSDLSMASIMKVGTFTPGLTPCSRSST